MPPTGGHGVLSSLLTVGASASQWGHGKNEGKWSTLDPNPQIDKMIPSLAIDKGHRNSNLGGHIIRVALASYPPPLFSSLKY